MACVCVNAYFRSIISKIKRLFIEMSYQYLYFSLELFYITNCYIMLKLSLCGNTVAFQRNGLATL